MRKYIWKILRFLRLAAVIQLSYKGIIDEYGWIRSFYAKQSLDRNGNPIPWYSYSAIDFLSERVNDQMIVFEFGSGNSTLWYSKHAKKVIAVEHDIPWFETVKKKIPENVNLIYKELVYNGEYCRTINTFIEKFDIIVVDGRDRNNCVYNSINSLTEDGVFIFDNSQCSQYKESQEFLLNKGFRRIDFRGLCPGVPHSNTTTIFYKGRNCLNI